MILNKAVYCTLEFYANHYWEGASGVEAYLRNTHRHKFTVKAGVLVNDLDREVEFIDLKNRILDYVRGEWEFKTLPLSCEMMAVRLIERFDLVFCDVAEDSENGAMVWREG